MERSKPVEDNQNSAQMVSVFEFLEVRRVTTARARAAIMVTDACKIRMIEMPTLMLICFWHQSVDP